MTRPGRLWAIQRLGPDGIVKATRYYRQAPAAARRAARWRRDGYVVRVLVSVEPVAWRRAPEVTT